VRDSRVAEFWQTLVRSCRTLVRRCFASSRRFGWYKGCVGRLPYFLRYNIKIYQFLRFWGKILEGLLNVRLVRVVDWLLPGSGKVLDSDNEREPGDKTSYTVSLYVLDARKVHLGGARSVSWKLQLRIFLVRSVMLSDAKIALRACLKINKNCDSRVHDGMHDIGNFEGEGRSGRWAIKFQTSYQLSWLWSKPLLRRWSEPQTKY